MSGTTYYQINRKVMLNRANDIMKITKKYQKRKQKISIENYLEKKNIKREYRKIRYHNISKERKQRLKEYQRNYREAKKHQKAHFKIAITKIFFICASINF